MALEIDLRPVTSDISPTWPTCSKATEAPAIVGAQRSAPAAVSSPTAGSAAATAVASPTLPRPARSRWAYWQSWTTSRSGGVPAAHARDIQLQSAAATSCYELAHEKKMTLCG